MHSLLFLQEFNHVLESFAKTQRRNIHSPPPPIDAQDLLLAFHTLLRVFTQKKPLKHTTK